VKKMVRHTLILFIVLVALSPVGSAFPGEIEILAIEPVIRWNYEKIRKPAPHGIATISRISDDEVVLSDTLYKLTDHTRYFSEHGEILFRFDFKKNDKVEYILTSSGDIKYLFKKKK